MFLVNRKALRAIGIAAGAVATTVLFTAPAQAATPAAKTQVNGAEVGFVAATGQANSLVVTVSGRTITFDDKVAVKAGKGCKAVKGDKTKVRCTATRTPIQVNVFLGDKDDKVQNKSGVQMYAAGHAGKDTLVGGTGYDRLAGGTGNDLLYGKAGSDSLSGGPGHDYLDDSAGSNWISGGSGNDTVIAGYGNDLIYGDEGNDSLNGIAGNDRIWGGAGNDGLVGGPGNDSLYGGAGNDSLYGYAGNDTLVGGTGTDKLYGGTGRNTVVQ
ncbi:hypothetical protein Ade02nite_72350 [Paractinoplanes deccanensis]|uniref:Hemolysin type calcium-binding protein n=1 Tax=Paractinoplanes deccanensis TaxID=113561 RepID=A0ABQ3YF18_9ACTN|nr:calcium-binding protein [Actinoplanes deccanensis]GID78594.1 hypothetical protein Ade02nite_72350 [Actinoplanes deccanensis]